MSIYPAQTSTIKVNSDASQNSSTAPLAENALKVLILGDSACGKSKLLQRFLLKGYNAINSSTYAVNVYQASHIAGNTEFPVEIWDCAGQNRFSACHPSFYHRATCAIVVFDCTRKETYTHMADWCDALQKARPGIPTIIACNKVDLDASVTQKQFAFPQKRSYCHPNVVFVSAADGTNVVKLFSQAFEMAYNHKNKKNSDGTSKTSYEDEVLDMLDYFERKGA